MIIDRSTDLTQFAGKRVVINRERGALITAIRHCQAGSRFPELDAGVGGMCIEDPHGDCRGGNTAFWWPYGTDLTLT